MELRSHGIDILSSIFNVISPLRHCRVNELIGERSEKKREIDPIAQRRISVNIIGFYVSICLSAYLPIYLSREFFFFL